MVLMAGRATTRTAGPTTVTGGIATLLLTREPGQRIPPIQELQSTLNAGSGTVVKSLRELEDAGAVELRARGRLGTVVEDRHVGRLWNAAGLGNLRLSMPPPGPLEQQAVMVAVQESLGRIGVPVVVDFRGGSRMRLDEVFHERAHAALVSISAFEHHRRDLGGLMHTDLGAQTFYAENSLVVLSKTGGSSASPLRVGIDRGSFDHEQLTLAEFADREPDLVPCVFHRAPEAVLSGDVDVAVWHELPTVIPPRLAGLDVDQLSQPAAQELATSISHAALVTRAVDAPTNAVLRELRPSDVSNRLRDLSVPGDGTGDAFWPR